jgi:glucosamine-6-phosphate deaminase
MKTIVTNNYTEMSRMAARIVARRILVNERFVLGLPTGDTPAGMYQELVEMYNFGLIGFSKVITFNLDEYYGLSMDNPLSYHRYMSERLFDRVNIRKENIYIPEGSAEDAEKECRRYEEELRRHGGINLQVLGIGINGHIGFNEPGSDWESITRLVELSEQTRDSTRFVDPTEVPAQAITMGIKTIMKAREILLLASGKEKAKTIREALDGPVTKNVPASILQLHPMVTVLVDKEAYFKL